MSLNRSLLSVVIPVFNEAENLPVLIQRLRSVLEQMAFRKHQIILVSDGSTDDTDQIIAALALRDPSYQGIILSRNFGHQAAIAMGLSHARGSAIAILDGDLQDPPELLSQFVRVLDAGADVAYGVRQKRKESLPKRWAYHLFYRLLHLAASIEIPVDAGDFCCMRRCVLDAMRQLPERERFVRGLRAWVGFHQIPVPYERQSRHDGATKFTLRRLLALAYAGLFGFSALPVRLMQLLGLALAGLAMMASAAYFLWYLIEPGRFPAGWPTLILSVWFFGGVQMFCMGILGEYVFRAFDESRRRPVGIIRQIITHPHVQTAPCFSHIPNNTMPYVVTTGGGMHAR